MRHAMYIPLYLTHVTVLHSTLRPQTVPSRPLNHIAAIILQPVPVPVPAPAPQQLLAAAATPAPELKPFAPTIVGSGGIKV